MLKNIDAYILRRHKVASDFLKSPEQQILYTCIDNSQMCILSTWCHDLRVQYLTIIMDQELIFRSSAVSCVGLGNAFIDSWR